MKKHSAFKHKKEGDSILLKLKDNLDEDGLEYKIVPQYFLLSDEKQKDVYCMLGKNSPIANKWNVESMQKTEKWQTEHLQIRHSSSSDREDNISNHRRRNCNIVSDRDKIFYNMEHGQSGAKDNCRNEELNGSNLHGTNSEKKERKKVKNPPRKKHSGNLFNLLNKKRKTKHVKKSSVLTPADVKNGERRRNENTNFRKDGFVSLLRKSSKKILSSAEKVNIFKNLFLKIKKKDEKFLSNKNFVSAHRNRFPTVVYATHKGCHTSSNGREAKKEASEKEVVIKLGMENPIGKSQRYIGSNTHVQYSSKRECARNYNVREDPVREDHAMSDNVWGDRLKSDRVARNMRKQVKGGVTSSGSTHDRKGERLKMKEGLVKTNVISRNEVTNIRQEEYYEYGFLYEGKKRRGMNNIRFFKNTKGAHFKPKEITKLKKLNKRNCILSQVEKFGKNKMYSSHELSILEYCPLDMSIKRSGGTSNKRIISKGAEVEESCKNEKEYLCNIRSKSGRGYIIHKKLVIVGKKKGIGNCHISKRDDKTFVETARNVTRVKENLFESEPKDEKDKDKEKKKASKWRGVEEGRYKNDAEMQEPFKERNWVYNNDKAQGENNRNEKLKKGDNCRRRNRRGEHRNGEERSAKWIDSSEKRESCDDDLGGDGGNCNVTEGAKYDKAGYIQNYIKKEEIEIIPSEEANYELYFDISCKYMHNKIGKKREKVLQNICEKKKWKDKNAINIIQSYARYRNKKKEELMHFNSSKIVSQEKYSKKKIFFFENNKLRIRNLINKDALFNLYKKEEMADFKSEKTHIETKERTGILTLYNTVKSNDSISNPKKVSMCNSVNYAHKINLNKSSLQEKVKTEEILPIYPSNLNEENVENEHTEEGKNVRIHEKQTHIAEYIAYSKRSVKMDKKDMEDPNNGNTAHTNTSNEEDTYRLRKRNVSEAYKGYDAAYSEDTYSSSRLSDEMSGAHKNCLRNFDSTCYNSPCHNLAHYSASRYNSDNYDNVKDEIIKNDEHLLRAKKEFSIEDLITSVPKEEGCEKCNITGLQKVERSMEGITMRNFERESERKYGGKKDVTKEDKKDVMKRKKKKFHSYLMKFRSLLFFENRKREKNIPPLNGENGSNKIFRKKKFLLKRKKSIKKLKNLSSLNLYNTTKILKNRKNDKNVNMNYKNYNPNKFLLGEQKEKDKGRKTIVLDLDETLVHSSLKKETHNSFRIHIEMGEGGYFIYVNKRPGVDYFFKEISKYYEVVIFTASLPKYANAVIDKLDTNNICAYRLFRESCTFWNNNYVKDIKMLGRDLNNVIIIDNSTYVQKFCADNCFLIKSWFDDPTDTELYNLIPFLKKLSTKKSVICELKKYNKKRRNNKFLNTAKIF
ncbi:NLI interacting factor-like phosphatase, putative [Plasmodium ovale]|uniref:NLI interacting factor-like phosphatase, putative n=1 Tax=Plasmodium ovale TaxID=36330 RepID=A0A1D3U991_PLAOA|nr:NLI interacting factor-like phosphatase, putative [Plasmodium ovale]